MAAVTRAKTMDRRIITVQRDSSRNECLSAIKMTLIRFNAFVQELDGQCYCSPEHWDFLYEMADRQYLGNMNAVLTGNRLEELDDKALETVLEKCRRLSDRFGLCVDIPKKAGVADEIESARCRAVKIGDKIKEDFVCVLICSLKISVRRPPISAEVFDKNRNYEKSMGECVEDKNFAMINLTLQEIIAFAEWLNKEQGLDLMYDIEVDGTIWQESAGNGYRLKSSEEWEWAKSGGKKTRGFEYPGSDNLLEVAWCAQNPKEKMHQPGLKKPNGLGIYDMLGNADEFCKESRIGRER